MLAFEESAVMIIKKTCVIVTTPLGIEGKGGIDRLMRNLSLSLHDYAEDGFSIVFVTTRGERSLAWSFVLVLFCCARILFYRCVYRKAVVHLNVAARGSTYRKMAVSYFARLIRVPYVIHLHGSGYVEFFNSTAGIARSLIRNFYGGASSVIVLGESWSAFMRSKIDVPPDRVVVIKNATNSFPIFNRQADNRMVRLVFLGEIGDRKGTFDLLIALDKIRGLKNWHAVVAGNGRVGEFRVMVSKLGLDGRISVPGWLEAGASRQLLMNSDILILPSYAENLPMAVIEAMAAGIPVVATPVGATAEIVQDGETGYLVRPGDIEQISKILAVLIRDKDLRISFGANARRIFDAELSMESFRKKLVRQWSLAAGVPEI